MERSITIRINENLFEKIESFRDKNGYNSTANALRFLLQKGLDTIESRETNKHLLSQTSQAVTLGRELIQILVQDENQVSKIIQNSKKTADDWLASFVDQVEL